MPKGENNLGWIQEEAQRQESITAAVSLMLLPSFILIFMLCYFAEMFHAKIFAVADVLFSSTLIS